jgi:DNA-binding transcriptional MerR regulator
MASALTIGKLASAVDVSTDTIRYYERLGLLPRAGRTQAGYRLYSAEQIERLRFIKQAQSLGLSLDEIKGLLPEQGAGLSECRRVRDLLIAKLGDIDKRLAKMRKFRKTLATYLEECEDTLASKRGDCCPVLGDITRPGRITVKKGSKKGVKQ